MTRLDLPAGPGIRVDTGVSEGDTIPADFDSMIAKIIAYGRDRDERWAACAGRWRTPLWSSPAAPRRQSFVLDLLDQPEVIDASADTGWIDRVRGEVAWSRTGTPPWRWPPPRSRRTRRTRPPSGSGCCPRPADARRCSTAAAGRWT
ncbi:hypothetical protein V2I01_34265 [Micromonospora sp. BRA006-A]|nr:hypothetical protein [Micromonospora sp. BRA006-A]